MLHRLLFAAIVLFWLIMNALLWRAEFGQRGDRSSIPAERVWQKILTAPDNSSLNIYHHKVKIGYCRLAPDAGQTLDADNVLSDDFQPLAVGQPPTGYMLDLEGNLHLKSLTNNLRFDMSLKLSTNYQWKELKLRVSLRPDSWEVTANAERETVHLIGSDASGMWEQRYSFSQLRDPEKLVEELGGSWALGLAGALGMMGEKKAFLKDASVQWEARNDSMRFGHSKVRVYRLETMLLNHFRVWIFVSRVGEILWVHLPDELVLSNDAFTHF